MTETTAPIEPPTGNDPVLSGDNLARVPLHQAREAAKKRGESEARAPRLRRTRVVQRDGREPSGFAAVLQGLMATGPGISQLPAAPCWTAGRTSRPSSHRSCPTT